jgi:hypothetical protein
MIVCVLLLSPIRPPVVVVLSIGSSTARVRSQNWVLLWLVMDEQQQTATNVLAQKKAVLWLNF